MTLEERVARAERVRNILNDELVREAFDGVRAEYAQAWEMTKENQERERERIWLLMKTLEKVRGHLVAIVEDGKLAQNEITQFQKRRSIFGR